MTQGFEPFLFLRAGSAPPFEERLKGLLGGSFSCFGTWRNWAKALELSPILVKKLKICTLGFMVPVWRRLLQTLGVASFRRMQRTPRNLPMHIHILYTYTCIHVCTSLSVSTYMHVQTCMYSIYLSIHGIYLSVYLCLSVCLSGSLPLCLFVSLSLWLFVFLCTYRVRIYHDRIPL